MKHFLNRGSHRHYTCYRSELDERICADYGIIHAFGPHACQNKRNGDPDVLLYIDWMEELCNVTDSAPVVNKSTGTYKFSN